jgi:hypothetical protein
MQTIIFAPSAKNTLFIEDIWLNLICGYDSQIIDTLLSNQPNANVLYSPSVQTREEIISSIKEIFTDKPNFHFKYFEELEENIYLNALTIVSDNIKVLKNFAILTNKTPVLYLSYASKEEEKLSSDIILVQSLYSLKLQIERLQKNGY